MRTLVLVCVWLALTARVLAAAPQVLEPVTENGHAVTAQHSGHSYPVFRHAQDAALVASTNHVFETSFAGEMLRLFAMSQDVARSRNHQTGATEAPELSSPVYLLLSEEEGGYARHDFFLAAADGTRTFVTADYIDLIVDKESVESGDFEEIFSHELGHAILHNLVGDLVGARSNKLHQSMTLTDYRTAFDEGFAEHFQPVARINSTNESLRRQQLGVVAPRLSQDFLSQRDQLLRNFGPATSTFIHERLVPACSSVRECYVLEETSTTFDPTRLRSGQQMLSSEGVVATAFLQLLSATEPPACSKSCDQLEASYRHIFEALADVKPEADHSPLMQFLNRYAARNPQIAPRVIADFLLLTRGATASTLIPHQAESLAQASSLADIAAFRERLHAVQPELQKLMSDVQAGKIKLDEAVGPELWIRNEAYTQSSLWAESEAAPLRLNLNTASAEELATLPGFAKETALAIVNRRRERGYFESLDDLITRNQLSPEQSVTLLRAARSQASAKADPVQ